MIWWLLFFEFFKIGLFALGGGLVTIPFLFDLSAKYGWFSSQELFDMIAISESSPGHKLALKHSEFWEESWQLRDWFCRR